MSTIDTDNTSLLNHTNTNADDPTLDLPPKRRSSRKRAKVPLPLQDAAFTAATGLKSGSRRASRAAASSNFSVSKPQLRKQSLPTPSPTKSFFPSNRAQPTTRLSYGGGQAQNAFDLPLPHYSAPPPPPPSRTDFAPSFNSNDAALIGTPYPPFPAPHIMPMQVGKDFVMLDGMQNVLPHLANVGCTSNAGLMSAPSPNEQYLAPSNNLIKPHPFLLVPTLYLSNIPPDMTEAVFVSFIAQCQPVRVKFEDDVQVQERLRPDHYYEWMPRHGILHFGSLYTAEKALAVLLDHPHLHSSGIMVSPFAPAPAFQPTYTIMPFPNHIVPIRYIRSFLHIDPVAPKSTSAADLVAAQLPTPSELFDTCRPWGAVRALSIWTEEEVRNGEPIKWRAKVEFWQEEDAQRFETGLGENGILIKGWQVHISADRVTSYPHIPAPLPAMCQPSPISVPNVEGHLPPVPGYQTPSEWLDQAGIPSYPSLPVPSDLPAFGYSPPTALSDIPPWASHHPYATAPITPITPSTPIGPAMPVGLEPHIRRHSSISTPTSQMLPLSNSDISDKDRALDMSRRSVGSLHSVASSSLSGSLREPKGRSRIWSLALENTSDGIMVPTGLCGDDGVFIPHGPGQHIRPAPQFGPGSKSLSGLVDYSNLYIQNLDPDINSWFLQEAFSKVGRIVSAKVMRDDLGRSRGYGFISFQTPEEAMFAIKVFDGKRLGTQIVTISLHEPRLPRLDRHAGAPSHRGRSPSPCSMPSIPGSTSDGGTQGETQASEGLGTSDMLRSLGPEERRVALAERISIRVEAYARDHDLTFAYTDSVVAALVGHDLALIPLLYNEQDLQIKIAETFEVLRYDSDLDAMLGLAKDDAAKTPSSSDTGGEGDPSTMQRLLQGLEAIDPVDAKALLPILMGQLGDLEPSKGDSVDRALNSSAFLAYRYGIAKKELMRRRAAEEKKDEARVVRVEITSEESAGGSEGETDNAETPRPSLKGPSHFDPLPIVSSDSALLPDTLDGFASWPAVEIMRRLTGPDHEIVDTKYDLTRPARQMAKTVALWIVGLRDHDADVQDRQVAWYIAKMMSYTGMKDSAKMYLAHQVLRGEEREALCQMCAYPQVLAAKVDIVRRRLCEQQLGPAA